MSKHYVKNIDIIKFKCFENFSSSGFSRVNLISGKNNIGKTAFMEAVYINVYAETIETFTTSLVDIKYMIIPDFVVAVGCFGSLLRLKAYLFSFSEDHYFFKTVFLALKKTLNIRPVSV